MTQWEAIEKRISCRAYEDKLVDDKIVEQIQKYVDEINKESGLHFQLFVSGRQGESVISMSAAMFSGPVYLLTIFNGTYI